MLPVFSLSPRENLIKFIPSSIEDPREWSEVDITEGVDENVEICSPIAMAKFKHCKSN